MPDRAARPETELYGIEVEVTQAMVEAGARLLLGSGLVWYREPKWVAGELARELFEEMLRHSRAGKRP